MCRLIESLKIKDGQPFNVNYHNDRMNAARRELFGCKDETDLATVISAKSKTGLIKCRIVYDREIREVQYVSYTLPVIRSLKLVTDNTIEYSYKYENRKRLQLLYAQKREADDVLIVRDGLVADSYFCNVVFEKAGSLFTPAACLLKGTKRQQLLEDGKIKEAVIKVEDIPQFNKLYLINAMIDLEDDIFIDIENVI